MTGRSTAGSARKSRPASRVGGRPVVAPAPAARRTRGPPRPHDRDPGRRLERGDRARLERPAPTRAGDAPSAARAGQPDRGSAASAARPVPAICRLAAGRPPAAQRLAQHASIALARHGRDGPARAPGPARRSTASRRQGPPRSGPLRPGVRPVPPAVEHQDDDVRRGLPARPQAAPRAAQRRQHFSGISDHPHEQVDARAAARRDRWSATTGRGRPRSSGTGRRASAVGACGDPAPGQSSGRPRAASTRPAAGTVVGRRRPVTGDLLPGEGH